MNSIQDTLKTLNLSDKEIQTYLACLELGECTVQELAEKSGVKRTSIYNFLDNLKSRGLISEAKKDFKNILIAEDPHTLIENQKKIIREKENQINSLEEILPQLMATFNKPGSKAKIQYFQGMKGLRKLYNDTLIPNSTLYGWIDIDPVVEVMGDWIWTYLKKRIEINMNYKVIAKAGKWQKGTKVNNSTQLRETKIVKDIQFDTEIDIYANKVSIYSFKPPYSGIIIEDIAIHNTMKSIWQLLWNNLK